MSVLFSRRISLIFGFLCLSIPPAFAQDIRALYLTGGDWHDYSSITPLLTDGVSSYIPVKWTVRNDFDTFLTDPIKGQYDVVVLNFCFNHSNDSKVADKIQNLVKNTMPAVLLHCAMHSFFPLAKWEKFTGMKTRTHDSYRDFEITKIRKHPILESLPQSWKTPGDELYQNIEILPGTIPLLQAYSVESKKNHVVAWTKNFGRNRIFATTLGHDLKTVEQDEYQRLIANGILWVLNKKPIQVPPSHIQKSTRTEIFTPPGMVQNPVALSMDFQNHLYIAETFRYGMNGVIDNQGQKDWVLDDLKMQTLTDRRVALEKWITSEKGKKIFKSGSMDFFTKHSDRVVKIIDQNGDGKADEKIIFADGFNDALDGIGAGILAHPNGVYYANIPNLWFLTGKKKEILHTGFGINVGYQGHDLHGLIWGPDGRIYFSIGDRGFNLETQEGQKLVGLGQGAVFRMEPDGTSLEIFASGLRNPQELAFDNFGNLFTVDNNSDGGDRARLVHVIKGAQMGWEMGVQYLPDRGVWNQEKIWEMRQNPNAVEPPQWVYSPIGYLGHGPSGLSFYPGTGLSEYFQSHFFLCDYTSLPETSSILTFKVKSLGAGFALDRSEKFNSGKAFTDLEFGYDGKLYASEWSGGGFQLTPTARIFAFSSRPASNSSVESGVEKIFKEGFSHRPAEELISLLSSTDRRVRLFSQYELAKRSDKSSSLLRSHILNASHSLSRIHALWSLGQIARKDPMALKGLETLLQDSDLAVQSQFLKTTEDVGYVLDETELSKLIQSTNMRVRFFAISNIPHLKSSAWIGKLLNLFKNEKDPSLRQIIIQSLVRLNNPEEILKYSNHASQDLRLGVVLALRLLKDRHLSDFLDDPELLVSTEAARAIYDQNISEALPALAQWIENKNLFKKHEHFIKRVLAANLLLNRGEGISFLEKIAFNAKYGSVYRNFAIQIIQEWSNPSEIEPLWGRYYPIQKRPISDFKNTLLSKIPSSNLKILKGNAVNGRILFESEKANCIRCHSVHGRGGNIGSDLTYIGCKSQKEDILDKMITPPPGSPMPSYKNILSIFEASDISEYLSELK